MRVAFLSGYKATISIIVFLVFSCFVNAQNKLDNAIIFKLLEPTSATNYLSQRIQKDVPELQLRELWQKFPENETPQLRKAGGDAGKQVSLNLIYELTFDGDDRLEELVAKIAALHYIDYAQPHYLPKISFQPDDAFLNRQLPYLELIRAFSGWDISKGDSSIVVGVIDTGTDTDHPDLVENYFYNYQDPINGLDDDGDGYIDNYLGWDLGEGDNDPQSVVSHHGVHMAGLIGATPDNGIGVAGVGYHTKVLPVKIAEDNSGVLIAAYEGVKYAADAGCDIINCSWGGYSAGEFERDIVAYATNVKNCLLIAAAGNDNRDSLFFPAAFEEVMAVAATDDTDEKVFSSNYHKDIDISAPGLMVYSTWNEGCMKRIQVLL